MGTTGRELLEEYKKRKQESANTNTSSLNTTSSSRTGVQLRKQWELGRKYSSLKTVDDWVRANTQYLDIINSYNSKINNGDWLSLEDRQAYRDAIDSYIETANVIRSANTKYGAGYSAEEEQEWTDSIASMNQGFANVDSFYNNFASDKVYGDWMAQKKADENYKSQLENVDIEGGNQGYQQYLSDVQAARDAAAEAKANQSWWDKVSSIILQANQMSSNMGDGAPGIAIGGQYAAMVDHLREDQSHRRPKDNWSDKQIARFGELYVTDPAAAYAFAEQTNKINDRAAEEQKIQEIKDFATKNLGTGFGNTLGAIAAAPFGMADFLNDLAYRSAGREITADGFVSPFEYSQAVTGGISTHLNEIGGVIDESVPIFGGKGWGDVYGLGTSAVQSLASAYTLGPVGTLVSYFGQGAASGVDDAISRGASADQALLYGAALGAFEGVAEKIGIDNLFKLGSSSTLKGLLKNIIKQSGVEGLEEGFTSILSNAADAIIMQDKSNFAYQIAAYRNLGYSEAHAKEKVFGDALSGILYDTIAGAASGMVSGGVQTGLQTIGASVNAKKTYGDNIQDLLIESAEIGGNTALVDKLVDKYGKKGTLSGYDLYRLVETNDAAIKSGDKTAIANYLTKLGEGGNVGKVADVVLKKATGEELTAKEESILAKSKYGNEVADKIDANEIGTGNLASELSALEVPTDSVKQTAVPKSEATPDLNEATEYKALKSDVDLVKQIATEKVGNIEGWTEEVSSAMIKGYDERVSPTEYATAFQEAFNMGANNVPASKLVGVINSGVSERVAYTAYALGKQKNVGTVLKSVPRNGIINTNTSEANDERRESIHLRDGGKRDGSKDTERQVSRMESRTGQAESRKESDRVADSEAARLVNEGREVKVADLGILGGSTEHSVRVVSKDNETSEMKAARKEAEASGLKVTFFVGDNLVIKDKNGKWISARAFIKGKHVFVRGDHPLYTAEQLMKHELGHDKIAKGEIDINKVRERIKEILETEEGIEEAAKHYEEAYRGSGYTADEIWEEMICDSLADMNIFSKTTSAESAEVMSTAIPAIQQAVSESKTEGGQETRKYSEGKASTEIQTDKNIGEKYGSKDQDSGVLERRVLSAVGESENGKRQRGDGSRNAKRGVAFDRDSGGHATGSNSYREDVSGYLARTDVVSPYIFKRYQESVLRGLEGKLATRDSSGRSIPEEIREKYKNTVLKNEKGELLSVFHWTNNIFKVFEYGDIGFHFGTYKAALDRRTSKSYEAGSDRVKEVYLNVENPIFLEDLGYWDCSAIASQLWEQGLISYDDLAKLQHTKGYVDGEYNDPASVAMRKILDDLGYDGIIYQNVTEDKGTLSVMALYPDQIYTVAEETVGKGKASRELDLDDYSQISNMRAEANKVREDIKRIEKSEDFKAMMDKLTHAVDGGDVDGGIKAYNEWKKSSGYGELIAKRDQLEADIAKYSKAFEENRVNRALNEEAEAIKKSGLSEADYFRKEAEKVFGYTPYFYDAGYIVPNGKMLNFSGEKGKHFGSRGEDHRAIGQIYANTQGGKALTRFMNDGNIRIMAESPGLDIASTVEPTKEQYATIRDFLYDYAKEEYFNIDISDENGRVVGSLEYEGKINPTRVINDIKHYYETGEIRSQSQVDKFRYSRELNLDYDENIEATKTLTNRDILVNALESATTSQDELDKLREYKKNIEQLNKKNFVLGKLKEEIKAMSFGKGQRDTAKLAELKEKAAKLERTINYYDSQLTRLEAMKPVRDLVQRERAKAYKKAAEKGREALRRNVEGRHKTAERHAIKALKDKFIKMMDHPTDKQYIPASLVSAMVDVCSLIDTDTDLYKADGSINKAQQKRNEQMERLLKLRDEYAALGKNPDPMYSGEFDQDILEYLDELRQDYTGKSLAEMTLVELQELRHTLKAIDETLMDARKLIGWGEADNVYDAGDRIIDDQRAITEKRRGKGENTTTAMLIDNSLSPLRNIKRMAGYKADSPLVKLFRDIELGVRNKNKFVMDAYKSFEPLTSGENAKKYEDAIFKPFGKEYIDKEGRKFRVSKMEMMQAIMSYNRELANDKLRHVSDGGFAFADIDLLNKGKLREAIDPKNAHTVNLGAMMAIEFQNALANDKWAQEYMKTAEQFFDVTAKDAVNKANMTLKHRIIATGSKYIPYEVDKDFVVREITSENDIQQTISGYGMLKDIKAGATQPLIITGLNNILERHIDQVGNIHGLAVPVRNFNKVWNVKSQDGSITVQKAIKRNFGERGAKVMIQAVKDVQGSRIRPEWDRVYNVVKGNIIGSTFMGNGSVVTKQVGSLFTATAKMRWRDPASMIANLIYTMANYKKIAAEVDAYTATAWVRRQGMSDAELHTLTTQARKKGLVRLINKLPAVINPTKWITGMDSLVALSLWTYAKADVAKQTGLSGEELYKAAAEYYDDIIENTQSMSDALHRPEIQKSGGIISETLGTFKTDLYQGAGLIADALGEYKANPTKENAGALARAVTGSVMSAVWGALMTSIFAMIRYKVNRYLDDDDEITAESWLKVQGSDLVGDLVGYIVPLFGGELYDVISAVIKGKQVESFDNMVLNAINDLISAFTGVANAVRDGEWMSEAATKKLVNSIGSAFGVPTANMIRLWDAIRLHAEDIANGEFLSFEAGKK